MVERHFSDGPVTATGESAYTHQFYCDSGGNMPKVWNHAYAWDGADRLTKFDRYEGTSSDCTYGYIPGS